MPGIASDRSPGIQVGPITAIGSDVQPAPAITDFMDAFRAGFITPEDIQRRAQSDRLSNDNELTQLQAGEIQRKLAPGAAENALAAQGLTAAQIEAAKRVLPGATNLTISGQQSAQQEADRQAALTSDDAARHQQAVEDAAKRNFIDVFGHPPPKSIEIPAVNPPPVDDFNTWLEKEHGTELQKQINEFEPGVPEPKDAEKILNEKVNSYVSGFPLNSKEDNAARAEYANRLEEQMKQLPTPDQLRAQFANKAEAQLRENPAIRTQYENYRVQQSKVKDKVVEGTPEYADILRQRLQDAQDKAALRAAKITALPKILEEQATIIAKAAAGDAQAKEKLAGDLRGEIDKSKNMNTLGEENKFANRILDLTDPQKNPTPSNADALAALEGYIKLLDPNAVIRQGKLVVTQEMTPKLEQLGKLVNRLYSTKGGFLTTDDITQLRNTTRSIIGTTNREARQFLKVRANAAIEGGVPFKQVFSEDQQSVLEGNMTPGQPASAGSTPPPNGAKRVQQNGVVYQWDGAKYAPVP